MARDVNIGKPVQPVKQAPRVQPPRPAGQLQPPPQRKGQVLPPGVTGTLPLPTGKVVGIVSPASMTKAERSALEAVGWTEDVPIPANLAEVLENERLARVAQGEEVVLPVDPSTPPLRVETKHISQVSPEDRERVMAAMQAAAAAQKELQQQHRDEQAMAQREASVPGISGAVAAARRAAAYGELANDPVIEDDSEQIGASYPQNTAGQKAARDKARDAAKQHGDPEPTGSKTTIGNGSPTGADAHPPNCPHCGWDMSQVDVAEPSYSDKMVFLHALLGQKCYVKDYELFGGNVTVTFRTLTTQEIDVVYKQAWRDRETQKVITEVDYWERVNRYRLFLQMLALKSADSTGFVHELPDGLSKEANPGCTATWNVGDDVATPADTPLPAIEEWIIAHVLTTEAVFRVVNTKCNQFNRLVARMEAMADNSDFWKPTEAQS